MPLGLRRGSVTAITERADGLIRLEGDGVPCVAYPRLTGDVEVGDDVVVNEQARLLAGADLHQHLHDERRSLNP